MTGWQPGDGGWNQQNQPFGPDAQTSGYGQDPYANPYGQDQYGYGNQYPADPHQQYGADPYAGGYPQQYGQYPPTGGFPAQGYGPPPPPPKRSKLPMVLSLVAIVIIVGAVVAIVLVNRQDNQPVAQNDPTSTTAPSEQKTTAKSDPVTPPTSGGGGDRADWLTIDNTADAGLTYQVPPDWEQASGPRDSGLGVDFTGGADYGVYECGDANYIRTFAASGDVLGTDGKDLDLATTVEDFAKSFAAQGYGEDAQVDLPSPTETEVDGKPAMTLTAKVKQNVTSPECQATDGEIGIVGVLLEGDGQPKGVAMLVVVNDLAGGPADPKCLDASVTQEILSTVKAG